MEAVKLAKENKMKRKADAVERQNLTMNNCIVHSVDAVDFGQDTLADEKLASRLRRFSNEPQDLGPQNQDKTQESRQSLIANATHQKTFSFKKLHQLEIDYLNFQKKLNSMNRLSNKKIIAQLEYTTEKVFRKLKSISKLESSFQVTIKPTASFDAIGEKINSFKIHGNEENVEKCYEYYQNFSSENFEFWDNKLTLKKEKQERHKTRQQSEMARRQIKDDNRRWLMESAYHCEKRENSRNTET